jgi:hypothetical protein
MAVREFTDARGVAWNVWPVTPDQIQPRTAAEDYLGAYGAGWLCFESAVERRRLASYPRDWERLSDAELCALLEKAAPASGRRTSHLPPKSPPGP